jgi:glycosyltransferase involved in cell wall biosynthesis
VAGTPITFAEACCRLYQNERLWQQLRSNALLRVINDLTDEVFGKAIASVINNVSLKGEPQWTMLKH